MPDAQEAWELMELEFIAPLVDEIEARVCIPLDSPILKTGPRLRKSRTPATVLSIRRSSRLAAKPRAVVRPTQHCRLSQS